MLRGGHGEKENIKKKKEILTIFNRGGEMK